MKVCVPWCLVPVGLLMAAGFARGSDATADGSQADPVTLAVEVADGSVASHTRGDSASLALSSRMIAGRSHRIAGSARRKRARRGPSAVPGLGAVRLFPWTQGDTRSDPWSDQIDEEPRRCQLRQRGGLRGPTPPPGEFILKMIPLIRLSFLKSTSCETMGWESTMGPWMGMIPILALNETFEDAEFDHIIEHNFRINAACLSLHVTLINRYHPVCQPLKLKIILYKSLADRFSTYIIRRVICAYIR